MLNSMRQTNSHEGRKKAPTDQKVLNLFKSIAARNHEITQNINITSSQKEAALNQTCENFKFFLCLLDCDSESVFEAVSYFDFGMGSDTINSIDESLGSSNFKAYAKLLQYVGRINITALTTFPNKKEAFNFLNSMFPGLHRILLMLITEGYKRNNKIGICKYCSPGTILMSATLTSVEMSHLEDYSEILYAFFQGRVYYIDDYIIMFHYRDNKKDLGEIAIAVKYKDGSYGFDKFSDTRLPMASLRNLKKSSH